MIARSIYSNLIRNAISLLVGNVSTRFLLGLAFILLARHLDVWDYGAIMVSIAFTNIASYLSDLGLIHTFIREGSKPNANLPSLLNTSIRIRGILLMITYLFIFLAVTIVYRDPNIKTLILLCSLPSVLGSSLQSFGIGYFQLIEKMHLTAIIKGFGSSLIAVLVLSGIYLNKDVNFFALSYGFGMLGGGLLSLSIVAKKQSLVGPWDQALIKELGYFTFGGMLIMIIPQMGPLVIERVSTLEQVSYFSIAYRIPSLLYLIPGTVAAAFYPALFKDQSRKERPTTSLVLTEMKLMNFLGMILIVPLLAYPQLILTTLFGEKWNNSIATVSLQMLSWLIVLQSFNYPLSDLLTTKGYQRYRTLALGISVTIGLVLYSILGAKFGSIGASVSALMIEIVMLILLCLFLPHGKNLVLHNIPKVLLAIPVLIFVRILSILGFPPEYGVFLSPVCYFVLYHMLYYNPFVFESGADKL